MELKFEEIFKRPEKKEVETGRNMQEFGRALMSKWEHPEKGSALFYDTMKHRNEGVLGSIDIDLALAYLHSLNWADSLRKNPDRVRKLIEIAEA